MKKDPTHRQRILRAFEHGPVNPTDFLAPNVCDGLEPILRLAPRIHEMRQDGYAINDVTQPNGTVDYILISSPSESTAAASAPTAASSTDPVVVQRPDAAEPRQLPPGGSAGYVSSEPLDEPSPLFAVDEYATVPDWREVA